MPAVLNEAFNSPFHRFKGLNPHGQLESTGTESIHNPLWGGEQQLQMHQNQNQQNQMNHQMAQNQNQMNQHHYQLLPTWEQHQQSQVAQQQHIEPAKLNMDHDCDRLIALIMSCPNCRNRLRSIMSTDSNPAPVVQRGGGDLVPPLPNLNNLSTTTIGNFIFGIAVIFLVDRIIRLAK